MRFKLLETDQPAGLYTTKYVVQFKSSTFRDLVRTRLRVPHHGEDSFLVSAVDVPRLASLGESYGIVPPKEVLFRIQELFETEATKLDHREAAVGLELYPFQRDGVSFLIATRSAALFDQMGLGKTVQALMALPANGCGVIVAPKSLIYTWLNEGAKWRPDLKFEIMPAKSMRGAAPGEFLITTPDAVRMFDVSKGIPIRQGEPPAKAVLILDEVHYYKTPTSQRTQAIKKLATHFNLRWILTGTPVTNKPPDLWGVLDSIHLAKKMFDNWANLVEIFGGTRTTVAGFHEYSWPAQPKHPETLAKVFEGYALRRLRKDVAPEIPEKTYSTINVPVELESSEHEDVTVKFVVDAVKWGADEVPAADRIPLAKLRAELAIAKIPAMLEFVQRYVDENEPLVVVSANLAPLAALRDHYECPLITGAVSAKARGKAVDDFQSGAVALIGLQVQAGGVGITLTAAHHMLVVQRDWSPAVNSQCEDRICRIGQKNTCWIYDLCGNHPLDTRIFAVLQSKARRMSATMEAVPSEI